MASLTSDTLQRPHLFFLHFNKTAGTSFYRYLEAHYATSEYLADHEIPAVQRAKAFSGEFIARLARLRLVTKLHLDTRYLRLLREQEPAFKAVTVYREPIERCYSQLEAWRRVPPVVLEGMRPDLRQLMVDARELPAEVFVDRHQDRLRNRQSRMTAGAALDAPSPEATVLLAEARRQLATIEFVGLTTRLADLAFELSQALGLHNGFNAQRLNATPREQRLSEAEREALLPAFRELNDVDLDLYLDAERRAFVGYSDASYALFATGPRAPALVPLSALGEYKLTMTEPLYGEGWHEREAGVHAPARWAGPDRFSSVYLHVVLDVPGRLRLMVTSLNQPALLEQLVLWVNDQMIAFTARTEAGLLVLETEPIAPHHGSGAMRLLFESPASASTERVAGVADYRRKTLALECIELLAVASGTP